MGRPRVEIDWKKFDTLCALQCSLAEIASAFDCSEDTIERAVKREHKMSFAEYFALKRGSGKISLRRRQYQKAMDGDTTMLIFLGKQWLGQADKQLSELKQEISGEMAVKQANSPLEDIMRLMKPDERKAFVELIQIAESRRRADTTQA